MIEQQFILNADVDFASYMNKYMRNQFKFYGVRSPIRKKIQKRFFDSVDIFDRELVFDLFKHDFREMQYVSIDYLINFKNELLQDDIEILKSIILIRPWWDTVDIISSNLLGFMCLKYPELINSNVYHWVNNENLWLRRASIIFQLRYRHKTNLDFLVYCIKSNLNDDEFFIQKAIGWALREYSKIDDKWVVCFLDKYKVRGLARSQALRYLNRRINS